MILWLIILSSIEILLSTMDSTRDPWTGLSANDQVFWEGSLNHFGLYKSGPPVQKMGVDTSYSNLRKIRIDDTRDYIGFYFVYSFSCDYFNANWSWMEISAAPHNSGNDFPSALESVNGWIDANATNGYCIDTPNRVINEPNVTFLGDQYDNLDYFYFGLKGGWQLVYGKLFGTYHTLSPTISPTPEPTSATNPPSVSPSNFPSINPTIAPSLSPSLPTISPTFGPTNSPTRDPWTGILDVDDVLWEGSFDHFGTLNNNGQTVVKLGINTTYSTMRKIGPIDASNHRDLYFVYKFRCDYYDESYSYMQIAVASESNQRYATYSESAKGWDPDSDIMIGPCINNSMETIDYPNITYFPFFYDNIDTFYLGLAGGWELVYGKLFGTGPSLSPTTSPTIEPTQPSSNPTTAPSNNPTENTVTPTISPTIAPTQPSISPTIDPTRDPWTGLSADDHLIWEGSLDHFGLYKYPPSEPHMYWIPYDVNSSYLERRTIGP